MEIFGMALSGTGKAASKKPAGNGAVSAVKTPEIDNKRAISDEIRNGLFCDKTYPDPDRHFIC